MCRTSIEQIRVVAATFGNAPDMADEHRQLNE